MKSPAFKFVFVGFVLFLLVASGDAAVTREQESDDSSSAAFQTKISGAWDEINTLLRKHFDEIIEFSPEQAKLLVQKSTDFASAGFDSSKEYLEALARCGQNLATGFTVGTVGSLAVGSGFQLAGAAALPTIMSTTGTVVAGVGTIQSAVTAAVASFSAAGISAIALPALGVGAAAGTAYCVYSEVSAPTSSPSPPSSNPIVS